MSAPNPNASTVCLDVGKTTVKVLVTTSQGQCASLSLPSPGLLAANDVATQIVDAVAEASRDLLPGTGFDVYAAVAGINAYPAAASALHTALREWSRDGTVILASDVVAAYASAYLGDESGCVLVAGTGSVALAVDSSGQPHYADGLGPLLGDRGSGSWIGLEGLRIAVDPSATSVLRELAERHYGPVRGIPEHLAQSPNWTATVAAFAPYVIRAAAGGDLQAASLVTAAVSHLHRTVLESATPARSTSVALVGGLFADPERHLERQLTARLEGAGLHTISVAANPLAGMSSFAKMSARHPHLFWSGADQAGHGPSS